MADKKTIYKPVDYIKSLSEEQGKMLKKIRQVIKKNLPKGFSECIQYGMLSYAVPLSKYPKGYHAAPGQPLPFMFLAAKKNTVNFYHMGLYADPVLHQWFVKEYIRQAGKKPDMGKSCIRFKDPEKIPFALIATLVSKIKPEAWIRIYEKNLSK